MSERWWRRRRRFDPWSGDFFEEADKMDKIMDDVIREAFGNPAEREKARRRYVYHFGDSHPTYSGGSQISEEYEPLVDVFTDETSVVIVAQLPCVHKDHIKVHATEDKVTISMDSPEHSYYKELNLPTRVDPKSSTTSCKNGVLEVRLKKLLDERLFIR